VPVVVEKQNLFSQTIPRPPLGSLPQNDIQQGVPSPFPRPVDIASSVPTAQQSSASPTTLVHVTANGQTGENVGEEAVDPETLLEQSLLAGAWSAYRRTPEGRNVTLATDGVTSNARESQRSNTANEGQSTPQSATAAPALARSDSSTPVIATAVIRAPEYCEPAPPASVDLQRDIHNLFAPPKYLTLRCGASAPTKPFTQGCASTVSFFGIPLILPSSPSNLASWRTLIPVPMIWHKPSGRQEKWFATKEPPEPVVKLLTNSKGVGEYEKRTVGVREAGGGRDCYVMACSCWYVDPKSSCPRGVEGPIDERIPVSQRQQTRILLSRSTRGLQGLPLAIPPGSGHAYSPGSRPKEPFLERKLDTNRPQSPTCPTARIPDASQPERTASRLGQTSLAWQQVCQGNDQLHSSA
jgi:hypothetical protein